MVRLSNSCWLSYACHNLYADQVGIQSRLWMLPPAALVVLSRLLIHCNQASHSGLLCTSSACHIDPTHHIRGLFCCLQGGERPTIHSECSRRQAALLHHQGVHSQHVSAACVHIAIACCCQSMLAAVYRWWCKHLGGKPFSALSQPLLYCRCTRWTPWCLTKQMQRDDTRNTYCMDCA